MSNYYYTNISKLERSNMMDMQTQAEILEKRGEFCLADILREIIIESESDLIRMEAVRVAAENAVFLDEDF